MKMNLEFLFRSRKSPIAYEKVLFYIRLINQIKKGHHPAGPLSKSELRAVLMQLSQLQDEIVQILLCCLWTASVVAV